MIENKNELQPDEVNNLLFVNSKKIEYETFISDLGSVFSVSIENGLTNAFEKTNQRNEESTLKIIAELQSHNSDVISIVKETLGVGEKRTSEIIEFIKLIKSDQDELSMIRKTSVEKFGAFYYDFMNALKPFCLDETKAVNYNKLKKDLLNDYLKMEDSLNKGNINLVANHICLQIEDIFMFLFLHLGPNRLNEFVVNADIKSYEKDANGKPKKGADGKNIVISEKLYKQLFYSETHKQVKKINSGEALIESDYSLLDTKHKLIYFFFAYEATDIFFMKPDSRLRAEITKIRNSEEDTHRTSNEHSKIIQSNAYYKYLNFLYDFVGMLNLDLFKKKVSLIFPAETKMV